MKLLVLLVALATVSSYPNPPDFDLSQIIKNPEYGLFLQELHRQFLAASTTPPPTTTNPFFTNFEVQKINPIATTTKRTTYRINPRNPFFSTSSTTTTEKYHELKTSAPITTFPKNPFLSSEIVPIIDRKKNVLKTNVVRPKIDERLNEEEEIKFKEQATNAQYEFSSTINDSITDNNQHREEVRNGLNVKGKYSFSDGFFHRTVEYEADDKGYRVIGETVEAIGEGPQPNPEGTANVATFVEGNTNQYQINKDDLIKSKPTKLTFI